jgi:SAM-dependent methyltransferase
VPRPALLFTGARGLNGCGLAFDNFGTNVMMDKGATSLASKWKRVAMSEVKAKVHQGAQTIYNGKGEAVILGQWDPRPLFKAISGSEKNYWVGKRVLDIGANTFGLSIEIARAGASVVAIEPDPFNWYFKLVEATVNALITEEGLDLSIHRAGLFEAAQFGAFDTVLLLGVIYHFRDPQYMLDFLSTLEVKDVVISSQTAVGKDLHLVNRRNFDLMPKDFWSDDIVLSGWHPTRPLLERMLVWAGFDNVIALTDPTVNFPLKPMKGLTNSAYYRATKVRATDPEASRRVYYPR